jgi:hypothetical protein
MAMINDMLVKKPFVEVVPSATERRAMTYGDILEADTDDPLYYKVLYQSDFIRQLYPSGHKINSPEWYPDKIKYDEENKRFVTQRVVRCAFPFQYIILVQQLVHLCGNDIHIELTSPNPTAAEKDCISELRRAWLDKNMEIAFYDLARSVKTTGDGAVVIYMDGGKVCSRTLSFLNGDKLYPHYDSVTGKMDSFARQYDDLSEDGKRLTSWVEVWDTQKMSRYRRDRAGVGGAVAAAREMFGREPYTLVDQSAHGFGEVPVAYMRSDGPCWLMSQPTIEKYELAVSHLCQNNMAYAFPITVLKGDDVQISGDIYGDVKAYTMGKDDSVEYLQAPQASESFKLQLDTMLKMIFMGSFIVQPPEIKSGDMPGVAIKLIYSPSVERAIKDSKEYDGVLDTMLRLFRKGYGVETARLADMTGFGLFSWLEPYVHQNTAELINNLATSVQNTFLSHQSATECIPQYAKNDELRRLLAEKKEEQESDGLADLGGAQATPVNPESTPEGHSNASLNNAQS